MLITLTQQTRNHLLDHAKPFFVQRLGFEPSGIGLERLMAGIDELKSRSKTLVQFVDEATFYVKDLPLSYDEKAQKNIDESKDVLSSLLERFEAHDGAFKADFIQETCKEMAEEMREGKLGKVAMPLRASFNRHDGFPVHISRSRNFR